jgi:hypothetical protein
MQHDSAVVKTAAPLATRTEEEQRSEGVKHIEIHPRMKVQYGDGCLSLQQVYKWLMVDWGRGYGATTPSHLGL